MPKQYHITKELRAIYDNGQTQDSVERLQALIKHDDLTSPERLTEFLLELVQSERLRISSASSVATESLLQIDERNKNNLGIIHTPPEVAFYCDGMLYDPKDIKRFNGLPLHFTFLPEGSHMKLVAFKKYKDLLETLNQLRLVSHVREAVFTEIDSGGFSKTRPGRGTFTIEEANKERPGANGNLTPQAVRPCPTANNPAMVCSCDAGNSRPTAGAQFFEHTDYDGHWFWVEPGWQIADLTQMRLSRSLFSGGESWNDAVSSIKVGDGILILFEHINFQCPTLTLQGVTPTSQTLSSLYGECPPITYWSLPSQRMDVPNLVPYGWNDRLSSVQHFRI